MRATLGRAARTPREGDPLCLGRPEPGEASDEGDRESGEAG
jgi:hypothetical protein